MALVLPGAFGGAAAVGSRAMSDPLEPLDMFLDGRHQRPLTQVLRERLAQGRGLTLAFGHGPSAERLIATLARTFPDERVHLTLLEAEPVRVTSAPQAMAPRVSDGLEATRDALLRSILRQDPDAVAVTRLEGLAAPPVLQTLLTGRQLLLGVGAPTLEAALAALCAGSDGLEGEARASLDLACELDERGRLRRVLARGATGGVVELARAEGGGVVVGSGVPPGEASPSAPSGPSLAPPLDARAPAIRAPRAAFLPVTAPGQGRALLGTRSAHRPRGAGWPTCGDCGGPLALLVQLDLSALPPPLAARPGLAQLFVCSAGGCEVGDERAKGVRAEVLDEGELELVEAPPALQVEVVEAGVITGWRRFEEEPTAEDLRRLGRPLSEDEALSWGGPLRCDKLGGWPAWTQGLGWPGDAEGGGFELLFQVAEGAVLAGGTPDRWDEATSTLRRGEPPAPVLDPNAPRHFPSVLTAEAVAFLLWQPATRRLAFRWQTG
jgi:hypothetical protein